MRLVNFKYIDALRGWAILGVVLVHSTQWVTPSSQLFDALAREGARGVQLFFVISAFTLFGSMTARCQEPRFIVNFLIRRFFRIAPLFYLSLIGYTCLNGFNARYFAPEGVAWWFFPLTISFFNGWMPQTINSVVPGGWSIAVEAMFYVSLPLLFTKIRGIKASLFFLGGGAAVCAGVEHGDITLSLCLLPAPTKLSDRDVHFILVCCAAACVCIWDRRVPHDCQVSRASTWFYWPGAVVCRACVAGKPGLRT